MVKKFIIPSLISLILMVLVSCQLVEPIVETKTVTVTVVETVVETVEVEKESPYTYELLLEMAAMDNYVGKPASGHKIAFANISGRRDIRATRNSIFKGIPIRLRLPDHSVSVIIHNVDAYI